MKNEALRNNLVTQAEDAFLVLMKQVDYLLDNVGFYLDRYPPGSTSDLMKAKELKTSVDHIASLSSQLAEVIKKWRHEEPQVLSRHGIEVEVMGELWVHCQAIIYFLTSHNISLDNIDWKLSPVAQQALLRCNRLLTST